LKDYCACVKIIRLKFVGYHYDIEQNCLSRKNKNVGMVHERKSLCKN